MRCSRRGFIGGLVALAVAPLAKIEIVSANFVAPLQPAPVMLKALTPISDLSKALLVCYPKDSADRLLFMSETTLWATKKAAPKSIR